MQTDRVRSDGTHEGFMQHKNFRWLKIAIILSLIVFVSYLLIDIRPRHNGGSWYGYLLGSIGVLLILWLTLLGVRKRAITRGAFSLKGWTSAHVYLGLSLIVIGTLHTGFQFSLNVHTLAYALMMIVIVSGIFGVSAYALIPRAMSANRDEMTENQMVASLRSIDRQLHDAAQPLSQYNADLVRSSLAQDPFAGGVLKRLSGRYSNCATKQAQVDIRAQTSHQPDFGSDPLEKIDVLLTRKEAMLLRVRKHLRLKAWLEIWLYVHVPITFALIAALIAHVISVFFYW
ncbi:MAG: hypothetical protein ACKVOJ_02610 [Sphingomonadaceae bacterium]